jgi:hypothetical protein
MARRRVIPLLLVAVALGACGEQQAPESMAGPSLGGRPTDPAACDPNSLNSQITAYFPGNTSTAIKNLKDQLIAAGPNTDSGLEAGYSILQEIGNLSRNQTVDGAAGSVLAQGIIKCMFTAKNFAGFPDSSLYNFAPALAADAGGAFYVRGGSNAETPVHGAVGIHTDSPNILSGVTPQTGTWAAALTGSPGGRALIYGYRISGYPLNNDPFVYEWATIPPATPFAGGAVVALCDDANPSTAMINESNIGVLAYQPVAAICDPVDGYSVAVKETGWGPRALAARLARVVVDAVQPEPLQATALGKSGTGGTATTFKSQFKKQTVSSVTLTWVNQPPPNINGTSPGPDLGTTFQVKLNVSSGGSALFGTCVYLTGTNNNGTPTDLTGTTDPACPIPASIGPKSLSTHTVASGDPTFTVADFGQVGVTKTGGIVFTVLADVQDRDGAGSIFAKSNVKPAK